MKNQTECRLAIAAMLALTAAPAASAGLVNGSFESGLDGWEHGGNVTVQSAPPYAPTEGSSLAAFNAMNLRPNGWIRQTVETIPGRGYQLFFDIGNLGYVNFYQKMKIEVTEDTGGGPSFLIDELVEIPGTTGGATVWAPLHGLGFTPSGSSVTVVFRDVSAPTGGLDLVIDNVRLEKNVTFVEVTTEIDENDGTMGVGAGNSLREVLAYVATHPDVDEIRFSMALEGKVITLQHGELEVRTPVVIDATQWAGSMTIDAAGLSRVMHVWAGGETTLRGLTLRGGNAVGAGGGMLIDSGPEQTSHPRVKIMDCTIDDNRTLDSGGGIAIRAGLVECTRTRITHNRAVIEGGGFSFSMLIYAEFDSCLISENRACGNGGGLHAVLSNLQISNSTLSGNRAGGDGGAIVSFADGAPYKSGSILLTNSTLTENRSLEDGAAILSAGQCSLVHCTVVGNTSPTSGAIHATSRSAQLYNSIITGFPGSGGSVSGVQPTEVGHNWLSGDPMLAPLADFGGNTPTMPPLPGSPVIDAAEAIAGFPPTDQRGAARPNGPLPDIGAVEAYPLSALQATVDVDCDQIDDRIEAAYGLTVGVDDSQCDSDNDGSLDRQEIANMTDPLDPSSLLRIERMEKTDDFDPVTRPLFDLWFTSFPGLHYTVECDQSLDFLPASRREWDAGVAGDHKTRVQILLEPRRDFVRVRRDP